MDGLNSMERVDRVDSVERVDGENRMDGVDRVDGADNHQQTHSETKDNRRHIEQDSCLY